MPEQPELTYITAGRDRGKYGGHYSGLDFTVWKVAGNGMPGGWVAQVVCTDVRTGNYASRAAAVACLCAMIDAID